MPDATSSTYRRLSPDDRRDELLAFGREHFASHAFDALSLDEIAGRAGVSKGTIYKYFGGRRGFYLATISTVVDDVISLLTLPSEDDLDVALAAMTRAFVGYVADNRGIYLALIRGGLGADPEVGSELNRIRNHGFETIESVALPSFQPELRRIAVFGWFAFVETATAEWLLSEATNVESLVDLYRSTLAVALASSL